jgi:protein TonB
VEPAAVPKPAESVSEPAPAPSRTETTAPAPSGTTGPAQPSPAVFPPQLVSRQEPIYPARARKRGEGGIVDLRVLVNEHGRVVRVVIKTGIPGSELEARAIDAALRSTYRPATEDGRPVRAWVMERFVFEP